MTTRPFLAFAILQFCLSAALGQDSAIDWGQHVIPTKDRSFDFQTVARGSIPEHLFVLKNPLQEPLHIANVTSSCTCTTVDYDFEKTELQTYEEFVITARLRGDMYDGQRNATITVFIDKPYRTEIQLNVRGEIHSDLHVTPTFIDFGNVKPDKGASRTLTVTYTGSYSQWQIVEAQCSNSFIHVDIATDMTNIGRKIFKVNASLDKSAPLGNHSGVLFLMSNDAAYRRVIPIPFRATVGTMISVSPPTLFLGSLLPGEPSSKRMSILSGTEPFRITKIECDNPAVEIGLKAEPDAPPKIRYFIPISYRNPSDGEGSPKEGVMQAAVRITTDAADLVQVFYVTASIQKNDEETLSP